MKSTQTALALFSALLVCLCGSLASAQFLQEVPIVNQNPEALIVESATEVLKEIMAVPAGSIPRALLSNAQAIAIVPGMIKGGFVIGIKHGRGVVVIRDDAGSWRPPSFITITGGSIGWQIGVQATDIILVFKTKTSVRGLLSGKFTIGGDVSAAAGPVGREASASTDATLKAEIYSYSRSRGLFAGAALDGSVISLDNDATAAYYRGTGVLAPDAPPGQPPRLPASAAVLLQTIAMYTGAQPGPVQSVPGAPVAAAPIAGAATGAAIAAAPIAGSPANSTGAVPVQPTNPNVAATNAIPADLQALRVRLADASQRLGRIVDPSWQKYLALPAEVYGGPAQPPAAGISAAYDRFSKISADPKYGKLTQHPEFRETFGLLKAYRDMQTAAGKGTLALPPPPQ
ncbi:MAG TPA: lipid-binding SYLF domain-containing protein [Pirellulales bacterium]